MRLEPTAQPKFVGSARRNPRQIKIRCRKLYDRPDAILVAQRHDVIPPGRIDRPLL